jgi:glycosyltransferase involved in cell wall biosynthesis
LFRTLDFYRRAVGALRTLRPVLVHCNDYNTMWPGVAARLMGMRVVYDAHELWPDRNGRSEPRWWLLASEALFVRVAHGVVTASPGYADVMARRYRTCPAVVVRNMPSARSELGAPCAPESDGVPLIVYVGGVLRHRGLEQAIDALALVPDARLRMIGPANTEVAADLRVRAMQRGVVDRFELLGPVPPQDVLETIRGADLGLALFQPVCLSHELVAPNKVFEYMAAGVPVVASDLPVIRGVVEEHGFGVLARPDDPQDIARAILQALRPDEQERLRAGARRAAMTLTWEAESVALDDVYAAAMTA